MARLKRFGLWNGQLITRETGKLVRNQDQYTIKESASGRQTVYHNGKYVGRISKGTKSEQRKAAQVGARRRASKAAPTTEYIAPTTKPNKSKDAIPRKYSEAAKIQPLIKGQKITKVSVRVKSLINFANYVNDAAQAGFISEQEAQRRFEEYKAATTDAKRSELWNSVHEYLEEAGYEDSG